LGADELAEEIVPIIDNLNIELQRACAMADYRLKTLATWFQKTTYRKP
jgi:hypothetical protein